MKYTAEFYSIAEKLYKIEIDILGKTGSDKTFKLSGIPFVSSISSDDKHIYAPIRCGGATIGVLTDSFIFDFYTGNPKGNKVTLINESDGNKIEWVGYVTPSVYSQGFDENLEELEIDCVDGIAVLKDIPYMPTGENAEIKTFAHIIFNCLKQSGVYNNFYITDNVQFSISGTESITEKLRISENNFADAKEDPNQTFDDVAWCCYDVLFEICQYLGYTLITEGNEVFIIDYDAIRAGNNKYFKYSLSGASLGSPTSVNISYSKYIDGADYSQNGSNIEMTEIYNKVTVKDEFNVFGSVFPHYDDIKYQTNITPASDTFTPFGNLLYSEVCYEEKSGKKDYFYQCIFKGWRKKTWAMIIRFYDNALFKMHRYTQDSKTISDVTNNSMWDGQCKLSNMLKYNGGYYYRYFKKEISGGDYNTFKTDIAKCTTNSAKIDCFKKLCGVTSYDVEPVTVFKNGGSYRIMSGDGTREIQMKTTPCYSTRFPFIALKDSMGARVFGGENAQLRIKGSHLWHDEDLTPFPLSGQGKDNGELSKKHDKKHADEGWFWAKLKWGNQYWNGKTWTTTESFFQIYFYGKKLGSDDRKNSALYDRWYTFCNPEGTKDEPMDYIIPCPANYNLQGNVEMYIYPRDIWGYKRRGGGDSYGRYYSKVICYKDFDVISEIVSGVVDDGSGDTDTIFTNVITNGAVAKMDDIPFKICTDDGKKPNYSVVDYLDTAGSSHYVTTLYNKALHGKEVGSIGCDGENGILRQEEHYIFKLATQYEQPRLVFECNLHNDDHKLYGTYADKTLSGKTFILTERDIDYRFNSVRLKMTEKF